MINIRTINKIAENGGLTLKAGKVITYKTGYQVATEGKTATTPREAMAIVKEYSGNCGLWLEHGIYYIDKSKRVSTKKEALEIGRKHNQISILNWAKMSIEYC